MTAKTVRTAKYTSHATGPDVRFLRRLALPVMPRIVPGVGDVAQPPSAGMNIQGASQIRLRIRGGWHGQGAAYAGVSKYQRVSGAVLARARGVRPPQGRNTGKLSFMLASGLLRLESASARGVDRTFRLPMPPKMGRALTSKLHSRGRLCFITLDPSRDRGDTCRS